MCAIYGDVKHFVTDSCGFIHGKRMKRRLKSAKTWQNHQMGTATFLRTTVYMRDTSDC